MCLQKVISGQTSNVNIWLIYLNIFISCGSAKVSELQYFVSIHCLLFLAKTFLLLDHTWTSPSPPMKTKQNRKMTCSPSCEPKAKAKMLPPSEWERKRQPLTASEAKKKEKREKRKKPHTSKSMEICGEGWASHKIYKSCGINWWSADSANKFQCTYGDRTK